MSRKTEKFFDAITHLREDLIEEAQNYKFRKKTAVWKKAGSLAACIVLIMSIGILAVLPRSCGGSSGGSGSNSSAAPQDASASGDTAPPVYGGGASGEPEEPSNGGEAAAPSGAMESRQFTAIVVEVQEEAILVVPIEYDSCYQYLIPFTNPEYPALAEGDRIIVTCTGDPILTANPPVLPNVQSIEKIDPEQ